MDSIASQLFGADYDPDKRVVRFKEPQPLRSELARIPESRLSDPDVGFFASVNPGHADGDELVCWARLSRENLTEAGMRMWGPCIAPPVAHAG